MSNQWLRLWHDMPNDPKWRTIARASKQPITAVISVYLHVLVDASANADERGQTHSLNSEDVASALDMEVEQAEAILAAMQGRVLEGKTVTGWEKRQPKREDDSAARAKAWRDGKKNASQTQPNAERTQPNAQERQDTDTDTDTEVKPKTYSASADAAAPISASKKTLGVTDLIALNIDSQVAADFLVIRKAKKAPLTQTALDGIRAEAVKAAYTLEMALRECVARGWQGFKAEWVQSRDPPKRTPSVNQLPTNYGKSGVL